MAGSSNFEARADQLIEQLTQALKPVRPVRAGLRAILWTVLQAGLIAGCVALRGWDLKTPDWFQPAFAIANLLFAFAAILSAVWALRSAIPGREARRIELLTVAMLAVSALLLIANATRTSAAGSEIARAAPRQILEFWLGFAALSWLALMRLIAPGVPLQPLRTAALSSAAACLMALPAAFLIVSPQRWAASAILVICLSAVVLFLIGAGAIQSRIDWMARRAQLAKGDFPRSATALTRYPFAPWMGYAAAPVALIVLALAILPHRAPLGVPDFDAAIADYRAAQAQFDPNIPSGSLEVLAGAYVDRGIPPYVWDFAPAGYHLVGGRITPGEGGSTALTLYRRGPSSILCVIARPRSLRFPAGQLAEAHHYRFYDYRGYRIAICYYGAYAAMMVSRIPMDLFIEQVSAVVPQG